MGTQKTVKAEGTTSGRDQQVAAEMVPHFGFLSGGPEQLVISLKQSEGKEVDQCPNKHCVDW